MCRVPRAMEQKLSSQDENQNPKQIHATTAKAEAIKRNRQCTTQQHEIKSESMLVVMGALRPARGIALRSMAATLPKACGGRYGSSLRNYSLSSPMRTDSKNNDDDIHAGFEMRYPTHTWTNEEVAKIKKFAAERKAKPIANDDDIHFGFECRFPTHSWTNEDVEKIKAFAKEVENDDDIHFGMESRFPTHTLTSSEIHQMESEDAEKKTEKV